LKTFKFNWMFTDHTGKMVESLTVQKLKQEFKFNLTDKKNELIEDGNDSIIRFDFMRDIFLERGL